MLWVIGNKRKFDSQGFVPVNLTSERTGIQESFDLNTEVIASIAGLAGFFHDIGKAMTLFQNKLEPNYKGKGVEPYRHEWISLRLFQAFVNGKTDVEWLQALKNVDGNNEEIILQNLNPLKSA